MERSPVTHDVALGLVTAGVAITVASVLGALASGTDPRVRLPKPASAHCDPS